MLRNPISCELAARDATMLAVLGAAAEGRDSLGGSTRDELVASVRHILGRDWLPTHDLIWECLRLAMEKGALDVTDDGRVSITVMGRMTLRDLLQSRLPSTKGGLQQACLSMKMCFLEFLEEDDRGDVLKEVKQFLRSELSSVCQACDNCPLRGSLSREWRQREARRLQDDLDWVERLSPVKTDLLLN